MDNYNGITVENQETGETRGLNDGSKTTNRVPGSYNIRFISKVVIDRGVKSRRTYSEFSGDGHGLNGSFIPLKVSPEENTNTARYTDTRLPRGLFYRHRMGLA